MARLLRLAALAPLQLLVGLAPPLTAAALVGFSGLLVLPIGPLWMAAALYLAARPTSWGLWVVRLGNLLGIVFGGALCALGGHWILAAEESARRGGGLMGGLGVYPIAAGLLVAAAALLSLLLTVGLGSRAGGAGQAHGEGGRLSR